jgi:hypothetical protein
MFGSLNGKTAGFRNSEYLSSLAGTSSSLSSYEV